jgi:hypothetical protein
MLRQFKISDGDFDSVRQPNGVEIDAEIAELFASRPADFEEFFADSSVRMKIGMLIAQAVEQPLAPRRRRKPR